MVGFSVWPEVFGGGGLLYKRRRGRKGRGWVFNFGGWMVRTGQVLAVAVSKE